MQSRTKAILSIFVFSLTIFMMMTTKYLDALGDYLLRGIGLKAWTGDSSGFHLTILFFAVAALIANYFVMRFAVDEYGMRGRRVFLLTAIFLTCFTILTNTTALGIKGNYEDLRTIGYDPNSRISFNADTDMKITSFEADLQLTNYAKASRAFYLTLVFPDHGESKMYHRILTKENEPFLFVLGGKESRSFTINLEGFNVKYESASGIDGSTGGHGNIPSVILTDEKGKTIELNRKDFFGIELSR